MTSDLMRVLEPASKITVFGSRVTAGQMKIMVVNEGFYCYRVDNAASSINQTDKVFVMLDEYKWIENWLRSKPELYSKFIGVFHYKKTHNCEFALSRLAPEFKLPFLQRYAEEYKAAYAANEIDENLFHEEELERASRPTCKPRTLS